MKKTRFCILAIIFAFLITSCAEMQRLSTATTTLGGAGAGALIGQAIGHNTEATLIGAAIGTMLGYIVGNEMDKFDRQRLNYAFERGASGQTQNWVNPDTRNEYRVTPERPTYHMPRYRRQSSQICRRAEIVAIIDGRQEVTYATACRDANGQQWQLQ